MREPATISSCNQFDVSPYKSHRVMQYNTWRRGCLLATLCLLTPRTRSFSSPINLSISALSLSLSLARSISDQPARSPAFPVRPSPEPSPLKHPKSCARDRDRTHETFAGRVVAGAYVRGPISSDFRSSELVKKYPPHCPDVVCRDEAAAPRELRIFTDSPLHWFARSFDFCKLLGRNGGGNIESAVNDFHGKRTVSLLFRDAQENCYSRRLFENLVLGTSGQGDAPSSTRIALPTPPALRNNIPHGLVTSIISQIRPLAFKLCLPVATELFDDKTQVDTRVRCVGLIFGRADRSVAELKRRDRIEGS